VLVETEVFDDFCQICHCCFTHPYFIDLVFGVAVIVYTAPMLVTVLSSLYKELFPIAHYTGFL
jgi:hypothetical protein